MARTSRALIALTLCSLLVFAATGCGKKKAATAATTTVAAATTTDTTAATTDTTATSTDTTAMTTDTTAMTTDTTATTDTSTNGLGSLTSAGNCAQLANIGSAFSQALSGTASNDVGKSSQLFKEFADKTPAEIRPDFEVVAEAYAKIADALKGVDLTSGATPSPEVLAKLIKLSADLNQAKLATAEANISTWAAKNCNGATG